MQVHNFPQYSDEWWVVRSLKMTASHAQAIGSQGKGLDTYVTEIVAEHFSKAEKDSYSNYHMQHGLDTEPEAAMVYQAETLSDVQEVGFITYNDYVGCSPDRLVNDDGLLEIKCLSDKVYFQLLITGKIESKYIWQMQMQMLCTGREWCDFFAYNPNFEKHFWMERICPDPEYINKLYGGFEKGEKMIRELQEKYLAAT
jgi:putative phage-type endonuclease